MKSEKEDSEKSCAGYLREPHNAPPVLYLMYPDGTREGLCRICANRWLLSEEEFPPTNRKTKAKEPSLANTEIAT